VVWAGLYWAWTGSPPQAAIALHGPGNLARQVTGTTATAPLDLGFRGLARTPVHQAFTDRRARWFGFTRCMDRTRSAILRVHPAPNRPPRGELLRHRRPLPSRCDHRRHRLSPSRIPSTHYTLLYPRPDTLRPGTRASVGLPGGAAVLVVRRSSHVAHAALAPGGVTY
jgi:hypothetical protein